MKLRGRGDAPAVVFLCLVLLLVFSDVLFLGKNFYFRDLTRFHYPAKKLMHDMVRAGTFPSWNASLAGGQPLAANPQYELFYPPQWLIFLRDFSLGYRLHILLHLFIAAIGMYCLLRSGALRTESALFGSLSFALGGLALSSINLLPFLFALSWIPSIAFFARRWVADRRLRDFAGGSIVWGMQLLVGEPLTAALTALLLAAYVLWRRRDAWSLMRLAAMGSAAALVACVLVVPGFDFARDSVRSTAFSFDEVSLWSAPPLKFVELLLPGALGSGSEHCLFYWGTAKEGWRDPYYISLYFGLLPLALAVGALRARVSGWTVVLTASVMAAILAVGKHTPLLRLLHQGRIFDSVRYPEKFVILGIVPLTIFSAIAFERAIEGDRRVIRAALAVSAVAAVVALGLFAFSLTPGYVRQFIRFWEIDVHPLAPFMARLSVRTWFFDFLRGLIVCGFLAIRPRVDARKWSWAAIVLLTLDLSIERRSVAESTDGSLFTTPPTAARPIASSGERLFHQADWYTAAVTARRYYDLPEAYWAIHNGLFPNIGQAWGVASVLDRDIDATHLQTTDDLVRAMWKVKDAGRKDWIEIFASMSNAGWRAMYLPFDDAVRRAADRRRIQPIIFLPLKTNPRFYFADQVVPCRDAAEFIRLLTAGAWSRRAAFVDGPSFSPAEGEVLSTSQSPSRITIRTRTAGTALLVCSITRHKYWSAQVDGVDAPILRANIAYQALRLPPGEHTVILIYRNPLIVPSAAVSVTAVCLLLAVAAYDSRRDRLERGPR